MQVLGAVKPNRNLNGDGLQSRKSPPEHISAILPSSPTHQCNPVLPHSCPTPTSPLHSAGLQQGTVRQKSTLLLLQAELPRRAWRSRCTASVMRTFIFWYKVCHTYLHESHRQKMQARGRNTLLMFSFFLQIKREKRLQMQDAKQELKGWLSTDSYGLLRPLERSRGTKTLCKISFYNRHLHWSHPIAPTFLQ